MYVAPIWAPVKLTAKGKDRLDTVQDLGNHLRSCIFNNIKAEKEGSLTPLKNRRKNYPQLNSQITYEACLITTFPDELSKRAAKIPSLKNRQPWNKTRKSEKGIHLQHESLDIPKENLYTLCIFSSRQTKVNLNLLRPCTKKEPASVNEEKGDQTIEEFTTHTQNLAIAYL
ncbi:hypothetical protein TNCV_736591 [Trichonephila clavipes]|nr:hypothetical protein TNCV_736591 [Trichonephila clavipes]